MHSIFKNILLVAMAVIATVVASAQDGTTSYQFLDVPVSTHVYALGGHGHDMARARENMALRALAFSTMAMAR